MSDWDESNNPSIYFFFLAELRTAYHIIKKERPVSMDLMFFKSFMLGRMIEICLKIELLLRGIKSNEFRKKETGSHDLIKLLKLLGYPDKYLVGPHTYGCIEQINRLYSNKHYEYPAEIDMEIGNNDTLERFIDLTMAKINNQITSLNNI